MQQSIFDEPFVDLIAINEAAAIAKVSSATIRNWIKAGLLTLESKGLVSHHSLAAFVAGQTGAKKLTGRANKSQKDAHDHDVVSGDFFNRLRGSTLGATELSVL